MKRIIAFLCCIGLALTVFSGCTGTPAADKADKKDIPEQTATAIPTPDPFERGEEATVLSDALEKQISSYDGTYSIGIVNLKTGEYVDINPMELRAASVIKVFVMGALFDKVNKGEISLTDKVTLKDREIERVYGTGILQAKPAGYEISVKDLVTYMIQYSDNRAANIIVDMIGKKKINNFIKSIGMKNTHLGYYFFLDPPAGVTNTTSTTDLNAYFKMLYNGTCVSEKYDAQMLDIMKSTENRTKLCALLPSKTVVAHKTGAITNVEHDAGIIYTKKGDFAISVLTKDVLNAPSTYINIANIAKIAYTYFTKPAKK